MDEVATLNCGMDCVMAGPEMDTGAVGGSNAAAMSGESNGGGQPAFPGDGIVDAGLIPSNGAGGESGLETGTEMDTW